MADIQIRVQLQDTIEDTINGVSSANEINNTSIQKSGNDFQEISTINDGINMKSWAKGYLSLTDGYVGGANTKLVDQYGYDGYVFGAVPSNKQLKVTIAISGEYIDSVIFYGDKNANQFPTKAYLDGDTNKIIYSDDPIWAVKFNNVSSSHTITFLEWNRADYNACLTSIAVLRNELFLDNKYIKEIESLSQITGENGNINYNVTANSGNIELLDRNGELLDYINDGILNLNNSSLKIYSKNNLVQNHITNSSVYDIESRVLNINITNELSEFYIENNTTNYDSSTVKRDWTPLTILQSLGFDLSDILKTKYIKRNNKSYSIFDYLSKIKIPYVSYSSSKKQILEQICELCQLNFVINDKGKYEFFNARPLEQVQLNSDDPYYDKIAEGGIRPIELLEYNSLVIPLGKQFSTFKYDIITQNNYDRVDCNEVVVDYSIDKVVEQTIKCSTDGGIILNIEDFPPNSEIQYCPNGDVKLCMIKELSFINEKVDLNVTFEKDNIKPVSIKNVNSTINDIYIPYYPEYNKDNFVFDNVSRNRIMLLSPVKSDYKILAIEIIIGNMNDGTLAKDVSYTIYGRKYLFNTENVYYGNGKNIVKLNENMFLQKGTILNESSPTKVLDVIANSILSDYKDGIRTGNITIACDDYYSALFYNTNEQIKKVDWSKGEIIKIGDFVRIDNDNDGTSAISYSNGNAVYWKVVGRKFKDSGVPLIDLELQEIINNK